MACSKCGAVGTRKVSRPNAQTGKAEVVTQCESCGEVQPEAAPAPAPAPK